MTNSRSGRTARLSMERLEGRDLPSTTPWRLETFDQNSGSLPQGWQVHTSDALPGIAVSPQNGLGQSGSLRSDGGSVTQTRAWSDVLLPADAQVSASIFLDSLVPAQIIARGQQLDTATPTYYAASITRGLEIQLLKVVDGQSTVLQTLKSSTWLSNQWVRVSLTVVEHDLYLQVFRGDTAQYLNAEGVWQTARAQAIEFTDTEITGPGYAGLARAAAHAGAIHFDNFVTGPPADTLTMRSVAEESFSRPVPGGLPANWVQWSATDAALRVSTAASLTQSAGLRTVRPDPGEVRSWLNVTQPRDIDVSSMIFVDGLAPAQVIARGQALDSSTPTYYAATITRGLGVQLLKVVEGKTTVLGTLQSNQWVGNQWVRLTLSTVGDDLRVMVYRSDIGQYLGADGNWQTMPAWAIRAEDATIRADGLAGLGRGAGAAGMVTFDNFAVTQPTPRRDASATFNFDQGTIGASPFGWSQWSNSASAGFQVANHRSVSGPNSLVSDGGSELEARAWLDQAFGGDVQASASIYLDSLVPAQLFVRGRDLDTHSPSYYAVSLTRGLQAQLLRVENGRTTILGTVSSDAASWDSNLWVRVTLTAHGETLQLQVVRLDSGQYLDQNGSWRLEPSIAAIVNDSAIRGGGSIGLVRPASYSGRLTFDDVSARTLGIATSPGDEWPTDPNDAEPTEPADEIPIDTAPIPPNNDPPVAIPPIDAPPSTTPPPPPPPAATPEPPQHGTTPPPTVNDPAPPPPSINTPTPLPVPPVSSAPLQLPAVPRHYQHIRVAQFAYHGTPMTDFEMGLLRDSIDLVIPNAMFLEQIASVAQNTPQFLYSNASNIYRELLTDWLNFADAKGYSREAAFYHVTEATPFTGDSASSWPVVWFWNVAVGSDGNWRRVTSHARSTTDDLTFANVGQSVMLGNTEKFREINFNLIRGAGKGWKGTLEYATAVDATGRATDWKTLPTLTDKTSGLAKSGQVTFDPPKDWVASSLDDGPRLYYVRIRTTSGGDAPIARTILGRDYVNAQGKGAGIIPAFDKNADLDGDGYLNDAEYANRAAGKDARFYYESRAFYPAYGQNRFAANVGSGLYREWAADYSYRFLAAHPRASGLFMDNSLSKIAFDPRTIEEPMDHYAEHYAEVLAAINRRISPKWVLANVAGGGLAVDALAKRGISYLEEFAIRPMAASYSQFEDVAENLRRRLELSNGKGYAILDSLAAGGSMTDPRVQIGTLAYYYLLAHPEQTMLVFNGGNDPNSSWTRHWSEAVRFNVGMPLDTWSEMARGMDPADPQKLYKVYQRNYENALVIYKPLSYFRGVAGTSSDATATTHELGGTYRPLNADGTLGAPITRLTLRGGEGAILVRV